MFRCVLVGTVVGYRSIYSSVWPVVLPTAEYWPHRAVYYTAAFLVCDYASLMECRQVADYKFAITFQSLMIHLSEYFLLLFDYGINNTMPHFCPLSTLRT